MADKNSSPNCKLLLIICSTLLAVAPSPTNGAAFTGVAGANVVKPTRPDPHICGDLHIRSFVKDLRVLEPCEMIAGSLSIALMDESEHGEFEKFSFPRLK